MDQDPERPGQTRRGGGGRIDPTKFPIDLDDKSPDSLEPDFRKKLDSLVESLEVYGLTVVPYSTRRGPLTQAKMWCRSRTWEEVKFKKDLISRAGAPRVADLLKEEYCLQGPPTTSFLPGQSWHQFGLAADIYALVSGKVIWNNIAIKASAAPMVAAHGLHVCTGSARDPFQIQWYRYTSSLMGTDFATSWVEIQGILLEAFDF